MILQSKKFLGSSTDADYDLAFLVSFQQIGAAKRVVNLLIDGARCLPFTAGKRSGESAEGVTQGHGGLCT